MSIRNIFTQGYLVDVNVKAWTGEKQLTAQDLGLPSDKLPKAFKLGKKALIPPSIISKFKHLDYEARKLLIERSFPFPFGGARFVPKKALVEFSEDFNKIKREYKNEATNLIQNYEKYKLEMRSQFLAAAKIAYERLSKLPSYEGLLKKNEKGKVTDEEMTEDDFINMFLERIDKSYPDTEKIKERFQMEFIPYQMELPDLTQATIDDVVEEKHKMNIIIQGYKNKITKELESYANKIIQDNRNRVQIVISDVSDILKNGKRFTESSVRRIHNTIENFKRLNVTNDRELQEALIKFRTNYLDPNSAKDIRNSNTIQTNMLNDLKAIETIISNTEKINALAQVYKEKLNNIQ